MAPRGLLDPARATSAEALAEAAADHDPLDVEQCDRRPNRDTERLDCLAEQVDRDRVPLLERSHPDAARQRVAPAPLLQLEEDRLPLPRLTARALLERRSARICLDAAAEPAVAAPAARLDAHVADLARRAAPENDAPVEDETASDPRSPEDAEKRPHAAAGAEAPLGLDGDVDVVPERDRDAQAVGELRRERERLVPHRRCSAALSTTPFAASMLPGAPMPTPASSRTRTPAAVAASATVTAMSSTTASGPRRGVLRRASPTIRPARAVMTAWIFVPPRSTPARSGALIAGAGRRRRGAGGSRARSTPRRFATRDRAGARAGRT